MDSAAGANRAPDQIRKSASSTTLGTQFDSVGNAGQSATRREHMGTLKVQRLLIVEDHPWVLQTLCGALKREGCHIESATTLRAARERILEDDPYDAVICEHHLTDGTGLELLGWLRWQQHIPVPFLLIARNEKLAMRHARHFTVLRPPLRADRLLTSLTSLVEEEADGMLSCQIPFAAEAAHG